jgi:type IV pilus assembly protein PilB
MCCSNSSQDYLKKTYCQFNSQISKSLYPYISRFAIIFPMSVIFDDKNREEKLSEYRLKEEEDLAKILAERYGLRYVDLSGINIDVDGLKLIPEDEARKTKTAIFSMVGKRIKIAILSPKKEDAENLLNNLEDRGFVVEPYVVSNRSLEKAWSRYKEVSRSTKSKSGSLEIADEEIEKLVSEIKTIEDVKNTITGIMGMNNAFKISRIVEVVLASAIATKSSDIHAEPEENDAKIRFRLDGVLADVARIDSDTYRLLLSRIKLLSGMKLNIKDQSQDGRFTIKLSGTQIEIRASVIPGAYNETIVLRLLDPNQIKTELIELGIEDYLMKIFEKELSKPNGMILNTGPTGSGKTTTLYAFMRKIDSPELKIITIEDPIEYHLTGIVQTQVDRKKGYDFASGLKSALRQDPDIIMVGEIRDFDTAETAIQAALTGHLVFSTLHTNTAAGAFTRLIDLGVNPKVLTSAINIAIAQRLVRKLCPDCKKKIEVDEEKKKTLKEIYDSIKNPIEEWSDVFYGPGGGCTTCNGRKFKGRIAIFEAVLADPKIEEVLQINPSEREVKEAASEQGIMDMAQDGVTKIIRGVTSIDEVERVVNLVKRETIKTVPDKENNFMELSNEDLLK